MGLEIAVGRQTIVTTSQSVFTAIVVVRQLPVDIKRSFKVDCDYRGELPLIYTYKSTIFQSLVLI